MSGNGADDVSGSSESTGTYKLSDHGVYKVVEYTGNYEGDVVVLWY